MDLKTVRGLGRFFYSSCTYVMSEVRRTFWLWANNDDELQGIELQFVEGDGKVTDVVGQYVYDTRGGKRD